MNRFYPYFVVVSCLWITGCVRLKPVSAFGNASAVSLRSGAALPVTFTGIYEQRVLDDSLDRHPFGRVPLIGPDFAKSVRRDSLRSYQLADSLTRAATELLHGYFRALAALSATDSTFVPVRLRSPSFDGFLQTSGLQLTPVQTAAFDRVVNLLGSSATGAYRRRRIGRLLDISHNDVRQMLAVLTFAHERLADVVAISREQQYGHYRNKLIRDTTLTYVQKYDLARQWLQTAAAIEQTRQAVLTHVQTLKTIRAGYDALYERRNELTKQATLADVGPYLTALTALAQLRADLDQLKPMYGRLHP